MLEFIIVAAAMFAAGGLFWLALWAAAVALYLLLDLARHGLTVACSALRSLLVHVGRP